MTGGCIGALVRSVRAGDKTAMLAAVLRTAGALALPPRCPGCGVPVEGDGRFCARCWSELRFLAPPWCGSCGVTFAYDRGEGAICGDCRRSPPRHDGVRAAVGYGPIARRLALKLKYGGRMGVAETMAALMARHVPHDAELIVPVPLHRWRLWARGYNQAALIAAGLARRSGLPCAHDALVRTRRTPVLRALSGEARAAAVADAFAVPEGARPRIAGRKLLLVDDVHTSGATANACAAALRDAGAMAVTVLCWARVLPGDD